MWPPVPCVSWSDELWSQDYHLCSHCQVPGGEILDSVWWSWCCWCQDWKYFSSLMMMNSILGSCCTVSHNSSQVSLNNWLSNIFLRITNIFHSLDTKIVLTDSSVLISLMMQMITEVKMSRIHSTSNWVELKNVSRCYETFSFFNSFPLSTTQILDFDSLSSRSIFSTCSRYNLEKLEFLINLKNVDN